MFDMAYSSLLQDLQDRGLLANTMVLAMGEFGRTPKVNPAGGRDHWPQCWSIIMAGGGVKGGQVIGASDEIGASPKGPPHQPGGSCRHHLRRPGHFDSSSNCRERKAGPSRW